jgi:hypothetical protein
MAIPDPGSAADSPQEPPSPRPFKLELPELELRILAPPLPYRRDLRCWLGGLLALFIITTAAAPFLKEPARPGQPGPELPAAAEVPAPLRPIYEKAINGDASAMCRLGVCYCQGQSVPRDVQEGVRWYRRAAWAGSTEAIRDLERMGVPLEN